MENLIVKKINSTIKEHCFRISHRSGLTVYIIPKDMSTTNVILGTKCGALDNVFSYLDEKGNKKSCSMPEGIAHFVEHKLFANPDGVDTAEKLALVGANCNAYTSFDKTAYMLSTKDNLNEALKILIEGYFTPYFTKENIEKERGIIAEEIKMYNDDPADSLFFSMLGEMFSHPYMSTGGCGTLASIKRITPDKLKLYHSLFYHPANTFLCICGKADHEAVTMMLDSLVPDFPSFTVKKTDFAERNGVASDSVIKSKDVACPILNFGIKLSFNAVSPVERMRFLVAVNILCEQYFTSSNPFISDFYEKGHVSCEIKYGLDITRDRGLITLYTETRDFKSVSGKLKGYVKSLQKQTISESRLHTIKKVLYSQFLSVFDSTAEVANELFNFACDGVDILDYPDIIMSMDADFVNSVAKDIFTENNLCVAVAK